MISDTSVSFIIITVPPVAWGIGIGLGAAIAIIFWFGLKERGAQLMDQLMASFTKK